MLVAHNIQINVYLVLCSEWGVRFIRCCKVERIKEAIVKLL